MAVLELNILCGVDIIEIDRIKRSFEKMGDSFRDRIFTRDEVEYCESKNAVKHKSYAARFAAKEAVSKAFGTGMGDRIGWKDIEIQNDENGKPYVNLLGKARELFDEVNGVGISISLSHSENYAVAFAVIQTK